LLQLTDIHQIQRVIEILGTPSEEDIMSITNEQARNFVRSLGYKPKIPFERLYPHAPPAGNSSNIQFIAYFLLFTIFE
jgi:hypothetical protein